MKGILIAGLCGWLIAASLPAVAGIAPELREEGVIYFEGNLPDPVFGTLHTNLTVYTHRDFQTAISALYSGQKVELLGMAQEGFLIKANYRNNTVTGWIRPEDLPTGVDPGLFALAQRNQARHDAVAVAISNKTVIPGMTPDEVRQSLGRPEQVASQSDPNGSSITWVYTTYRQEPQYSYVLNAYGQAVLQAYYVKVPIGQRIITFVNGGVYSVSEKKTDPSSPGIVTN